MSRVLIWEGLDAWRAEVAQVDLVDDGLRASGTQIGVDPLPYRVDYELDVGERFVTRRLRVGAVGDGWSRALELTHDGAGNWSCEATAEGDVRLRSPAGDPATLAGALDCDLGRCPLTNLMPVR